MKFFLRALVASTTAAALALLSSGMPGNAQTNVSVAPRPDWVEPVAWQPGPARPPAERSEGTRYLLDERQEHPQRQEEFVRTLVLMENETGVQDSGSLTFYFDPSYQQLILHTVQIHRGGAVLNRLDAGKLKTIQSEPGLDSHMLTGEQSTVLFVEDLRVGDVLEYAYTRRGHNPILNGHFSTRFGVQFGTPVDRQRVRVLWSAPQPLHVRTHRTATPPAKKLAAGGTEYLWDFTNLLALDYEDSLPAGYEPYPYVEVSDFKDWDRVVDWALPLYAVPTNLPAELLALIQQWQTTGQTDAERARLALEFVQDELRYTGLELGPDSYRPAPPAETFQKRFGDCKGKVLLLCTIYRAMNFEAWPALVNTSLREAIGRRLPSPFAFNHVIVKLRLGGQDYWLDPTYTHQGGSLGDRFLPRLGKALVVQPGQNSLTDIPLSQAESMRQSVVATFTLTDYESPASLTVRTTFRGYGADDQRETLARSDARELAKGYLNFYARFYPGITATDPLETSDDRAANVLTITEHYTVAGLWKTDPDSKKRVAVFYGDSLYNVLTDPSTRLRTMPLRIPFPFRREHEVVVRLPDADWNIPPVEKVIQHDAFTYRYQRSFAGKTVRFHYDCETKLPELPAEKVADYLARREEMEDDLGETLTRPEVPAPKGLAGLNWLMIVIAGFGSIATLAGVTWTWRQTGGHPLPGAEPSGVPPVIPPELQGLRGWLILVGFGLCGGLISRLLLVPSNWEGYFSIHVWQSFAVPQSEQYHPAYAPLLIGELLGNIALLGVNALALALFFSRRAAFPKVFLLLLWSNAIFVVADEIVSRQIPFIAAQADTASMRETTRAVFAAIIWTGYILRSRRVKATFIR